MFTIVRDIFVVVVAIAASLALFFTFREQKHQTKAVHIFISLMAFFFHLCCHFLCNFASFSFRLSLVLFHNHSNIVRWLCFSQTINVGKITGIYIEFLGKAHCQWTEGTGNKKETHTGSEIYLENRLYFVGGRTGKQFSDVAHSHFGYNFIMLCSVACWYCSDYVMCLY